jgi:hypothetical protein
MSDHILRTLEDVKAQVAELSAKLREKQKFANALCEMAKIQPAFQIDEESTAINRLGARGDEYYGKTIAVAIREFLDARQAANLGPATVNEIFDALKAGGYHFETASDANSKKSIRICLSKNTALFHKLPNGKYGLKKWYGRIKSQKSATASDSESEGRKVMQAEFGLEVTENEEQAMTG